MQEYAPPGQFVEEMRGLLVSMSSRRGAKRQDIIDNICNKLTNYTERQQGIILNQQNRLLLFHGDTNSTLRKRIDERDLEIERQKKRIKHLETLRKRLSDFGDRRLKEVEDLREQLGIKLPTFLDDTELT